jgi:hypothetical protein
MTEFTFQLRDSAREGTMTLRQAPGVSRAVADAAPVRFGAAPRSAAAALLPASPATPRWRVRRFVFLVALLGALALSFATTAGAAVLIEENFSFTGNLTDNGWTAHSSGGTNPIQASAPGLTYPRYLSSGIGNAASVWTSGEDDSRSWTALTDGSVYIAFLANVTVAQTGDYFLHTGSTSFGRGHFGRVHAKSSGGGVQFGVNYQSEAASYDANVYALGGTHLLVLKYTIVAGTANDTVALFVDPSIGAPEPAATVVAPFAASWEPLDLGAVALRQGTANLSAAVKVDGIRVATTWAEAVAETRYTLTVSATHGSVTRAPEQEDYAAGTAVLLTAAPDPNYHFDHWSGDASVTTDTVTVIVSSDLSVTAHFALDTHLVTASAGAHGSIAPMGAVAVPHGSDQVFHIGPATGYHVDSLIVDAVPVAAETVYTFYAVIAPHTIRATFASNPSVAPITGLTAVRRLGGNAVDGTTIVDVSWPVVPENFSVEVWRAGFGNYPEYDDGPAAGAVPATPSYPPPAPWTLAGVVLSSTTLPDEPTARDFHYYVAFVRDTFGTVSPVSNKTTGALNYFLGDTHDGATACQGNNAVSTEDMSHLGAHYGAALSAGDPLGCLDVGPTTNYSVGARPMTDNLLDFEDLMMLAVNWHAVSAAQAGAQPVAAAGANRLWLEAPARVTAGTDVAVALRLDGAGNLQGVTVRLAWDATRVEPVGFEPGALVTSQGGVVMSARPGTLDAALLGAGRGLAGSGVVGTITFRALADGDPGLLLAAGEGRDAANRPVALAGVAARPGSTALAAPAPNPFRVATTLAFTLAREGEVELSVYSVDGRRVATLARGRLEAGRHEATWDGRDAAGRPARPGFYYARLNAAGGHQARAIVLTR